MTAGELDFVIKNYEYTIMVGSRTGDNESDIKTVDRNSDEMIYVSGLMGLGVLNSAGSLISDSGKYVFAKFCATLKELIDEKV